MGKEEMKFKKGDRIRINCPVSDLYHGMGGTVIGPVHSYYKVEMEKPDGSWELKYTDDDFYTQMNWFMMERASMIRIIWEIPDTQESGTYRIVYDGPVKKKSGGKVVSLPVKVKFSIN